MGGEATVAAEEADESVAVGAALVPCCGQVAAEGRKEGREAAGMRSEFASGARARALANDAGSCGARLLTFSPSAKPEARQKAVSGLLSDLNADRNPIMLGPWRSELGFESMYWLPFLSFLASKVKDFDKRASIITRGGLAPLYQKVAHQGYDLYALRSVDDVRRENLFDQKVRQKGKTIKQIEPTEWDEKVTEDAAEAMSVGSVYHTVHPAWMYWALAPYWEEKAGLEYLASMTDYALIPKVSLPNVPLPKSYVAVKCYGRATFPYPHPEVAGWVQKTVAMIAQQAPVVLLNSGSGYDDHIDIPISGKNIISLPSDVPPEENLLMQTAVLSHATAFVGTYGGVSQLALRLGVPSCSVWWEWGGTAHGHLSLSSWLSKRTKVPFLTSSIADTFFWEQVVRQPAKVAA